MSISAGDMVAYLKDEARTLTEYYDGFDTVWGKGAQSLGLERGITREQFIRLYNGQDPNTGEQLTRIRHKKVVDEDGTERRVVEHNGMIDIVFGTPKSVSELLVASTPEQRDQIIAAVKQAAYEAFRLVERETPFARVPAKLAAKRMRSDGRYTDATSDYVPAEMIAVPVVQFTARDTDATLERGVADAHCHVHVATFTACKAEGRWLTANERRLKTEWNAKIRDAVFLGELARGLERLGVTVDYKDFDRARKGEVGWEVQGSKEEIRKHWSTNTERAWALRKAYEDEHGKPMPEVDLKNELYRTRKVKSAATKEQDSNPVWERWEQDLAKAGLQLGIRTPGTPIDHDPYVAFETLQKRLDSAQGFCRDNATFDQAMIKGSVRRCAIGLGFTQDELDGIERIYLSGRAPELVVVRDAVDAENRLYTTQALIDTEQRIERHRDEMAGRWVDLTGAAGTGKSSAVAATIATLRTLQAQEREYEGKPITVEPAPISEALKATLQRDGFTPNDGQRQAMEAILATGREVDQVIVVSMAAATAERTGLKVKADTWGSVESITSRIDQGHIKITPKSMVIIEEVGQLDSFRADRLLEAVSSARVVTLGDSKQLGAIGAAGWYGDALYRHGSVELTEVRRQADQQDVEAYDLVRHGEAPKALQDLDERSRVHFAATDADRMGEMFEHYRGLREAGTPARRIRIVTDSSNTEVDTGNRFVQRDRLERGEIGTQAVTVEHGERRWELRDNDQVIMLEAVRVKGEAPIKNGTTGVIMRVDDRQCRIRFEDGTERTIPTTGAIGLSYSVHIQKFQGGEAEFALYGPGRNPSRNSAYTALTRGVVETHVFASEESHKSIERLGEMMQRTDEKESVARVMARLHQIPAQEIPPVQSDELMLEDVELALVPDLEPIDVDDFEPVAPEPRHLERRRLEPRTLPPKVIEPPGISGMEISGPE